MTQKYEPQQTDIGGSLDDKVNRGLYWFSRHWLLVMNVFMGVFVLLPYAAPLFMSWGWYGVANAIYTAYKITCHQLPERSYELFGYQAALCHRCTAIWFSYFVGGVGFGLVRHRLKGLPFRWWVLAVIPIGLDGGTQLMGPLYEVIPNWGLTGFAIIVWLILTGVMWWQKVRNWQFYLFVACFPIGMAFVQFTGTRYSDYVLRSITGTIFGLANVWLMYPMLEESFTDLTHDLAHKLGYATTDA